MSLPWIKRYCGLSQHPKSLKLGRLLKYGHAWAYVEELWDWAATHQADGKFEAEGALELIEDAVRWKGEPGEFFHAALQVGFLDRKKDGSVAIHDWEEHAGAHLEELRKHRERSARYRAKQKTSGDGHVTVTSSSADGNVTALDRDVDREKEKKHIAPDGAHSGEPENLVLLAQNGNSPKPEDQVFEHWAKVTGHTHSKFSPKRKSKVAQRLRDGFTPEQLKQAVDGCVLTPHNMGQNEHGTRYDDLELICRDVEHVERFMRNAKDPPAPGKTGKATARDRDWSHLDEPGKEVVF